MNRTFSKLFTRCHLLRMSGINIAVEKRPAGCRFTNVGGSVDKSEVLSVHDGHVWLDGFEAGRNSTEPAAQIGALIRLCRHKEGDGHYWNKNTGRLESAPSEPCFIPEELCPQHR